MLLRSKIHEMSARQLTGIGLALMCGGMLIVSVCNFVIETPTFLTGFLYGLASVMMGLSIVVNIQGLKKHRAEQSDR